MMADFSQQATALTSLEILKRGKRAMLSKKQMSFDTQVSL